MHKGGQSLHLQPKAGGGKTGRGQAPSDPVTEDLPLGSTSGGSATPDGASLGTRPFSVSLWKPLPIARPQNGFLTPQG